MGARRQAEPRVDEQRIAMVRADIAKQNAQIDTSIVQYRKDAIGNSTAAYQQANNSLATQRQMLARERQALVQSDSQSRNVFQMFQSSQGKQQQAAQAISGNQRRQATEQNTANTFKVQGNLQRRKGAVNNGVTF